VYFETDKVLNIIVNHEIETNIEHLSLRTCRTKIKILIEGGIYMHCSI